MRGSLPAHRSFDVLVPFMVYRVIGRRPSSIYVDPERNTTTASETSHRLWDLVFEEARAVPGDQIQDRPGGIILLKPNGDAHPIQLSAPVPRTASTAFSHAELALSADRELAEAMLLDGRLAVAPVRRIRMPLNALPKEKFDENHPLVKSSGAR